jgi:hypothetical protein
MGRRKPVPIEEVNRRLHLVHVNVVKLVETSYTGTAKQARFIDVEHGEWAAWVSNVLRGHGHPKRGRQNGQETCVERYGVNTPLARGELREKIEQGWVEKYGVNNPLGAQEVIARRNQTMVERYGVVNPQQIPEVQQRSARTRRNSTVLKHWKTGRDVVCSASYELAVVSWLNKTFTDFEWQLPISIPTDASPIVAGRTYFIDLHVLSGVHSGKYVEIKGSWQREMQRAKWDWFRATHPTAELWDGPTLKRMGILGRPKESV